MRYFETRFLEEADEFMSTLNSKAVRKVLYNIDKAELTNDPRLFKKLRDQIWEFRIRYEGLQIRLLSFWDKDDEMETLVIATHGFIKKVDKIPHNEIIRALKIRKYYFNEKHNR
jgi:phage-related protein